jgi:hypothetical protein
LAACSQEPRFPSQINMHGLDSFNPTDQTEKQSIFDQLHSRGLLQLVHTKGGRACGMDRHAQRPGIM